MTQNIYKYAAKKKLTFASSKGMLKTEDLFDLKVEQLDAIYKSLKRQVKDSDEESLLDKKTAADEELEIKIAIITDIVKDKLDAAEAAKKRAEKAAAKQKIAEALAIKENEELMNKSADELRQMLNDDDEE